MSSRPEERLPKDLGPLSGQRVLFIGPQFFGYEKEIVSELCEQGAEVDFLPDRPFVTPLMKAVTRFSRELVLPLMDRFFLTAVEHLGRRRYDVILVIQGEGLSSKTLKRLRSAYPDARFIFYLWDSLRNKKSLAGHLPLFDRSHTFDASDAKAYGLNFRPLFFSPQFTQHDVSELKYQISFIGTAHSDRFKIVHNLSLALPSGTKCYWYLYLQAPWVYHWHKLFNRNFSAASKEIFRFTPLGKTQVKEVFGASLAILDVEHPRQTGLTMRTFETMGAGKKLITTNTLIKDYDFFRPNNILVIDRGGVPVIPGSFMSTPYEPLPPPLYQKYSRAGWLRDLMA